jgi:glycosyltransferase involved in cell wall biosynthesis
MNLKVSVIMPVYLGEYEGCASDRDNKFIRAIESFLGNTYRNKELVIVSDGCDITEKIFKEKYAKSDYIVFDKIEKQPLFSGNVRARGIDICSGQLIMYLDSDDMYGINHINSVVSGIEDYKFDWCYYNDYIKTEKSANRRGTILEYGRVGTSSIAHKRSDVNWHGCDGYGHDWVFIQKLMMSTGNYGKIFGTEYFVCHVPNILDS